jgi:epoxyqueuosine reductase
MWHNAAIRRFLRRECVDYVGFADLSEYGQEFSVFGGKIVEGYPYGISIGIALPDSIVDHLTNRFDNNVACEYKSHAYSVVTDRLDAIASKLSSYLNARGFRTLPIVAAERTDIDNAIPTLSHKTIAHIAGLGWIGKNCLLITEDHGPRVRFTSVLTQAPLRAKDNPLPQRCGDCVECVRVCPAQAIKGRNYAEGEAREERFDFAKCQAYFEKMRESRTWDVCGMCLYACPYGKRTGR